MKNLKIIWIGMLCVVLIPSYARAIDYSRHTDEQLKMVWKNKMFLNETDEKDFRSEWIRRFGTSPTPLSGPTDPPEAEVRYPMNYQRPYAPYSPGHHNLPILNLFLVYKNHKNSHGHKYGHHRYDYGGHRRGHHHKHHYRYFRHPKHRHTAHRRPGYHRYRHRWH